MKYVIIGAGVAGATAAREIRQQDKDGEIVLIGKEPFLPYKRYLLTEFFCGRVKKEELFSLSCEEIKELNIVFRKGQQVKAVDFEQKKLKLFHNEIVTYDRLLIATGGKPQIGPAFKRFQKYLQQYYSMEDVLLLKSKMDQIKDCIVYGQGVSTLDLMAGLKNLNKRVIYVTKEIRATFPLLEKNTKLDIHQFLLEKGIEIIPNERIASVEKVGEKYVVETLSGKKLKGDVVFAWNAYRPNIGFIEQTEIDRKIGILVNEYLRTSIEDVYAAGDCAEIWHPKVKNYWINFGYPNAMEQGKIAGKNMTGANKKYRVQETLIYHVLGKPFQARWWE